MHFSHWKYYSKDYEWDDSLKMCAPDFELTNRIFQEIGFSPKEASQLIESGYVILRGFEDTVIDRYYGGLILRHDHRTRIPVKEFYQWLKKGQSHVKTYEATSLEQAKEIISQIQTKYNSPLLYRGQTSNYKTLRSFPNPTFIIPELGEVSLIPSLWRDMLKKNHKAYFDFENLDNDEWQKLINSQFDINDIQSRWQKFNDERNLPANHFDLEDSNDPILQEYGRYQLDLSMGKQYNLAEYLATLLQHYGLMSPVLDLTSDLEVAFFFATHTFSKKENKCEYNFTGTNNQNSIIYILKNNDSEMQRHQEERFFNKLKPLRPEKQSCVISKTAPFAINLAADFLVATISLKFNLEKPSKYSMSELFPSIESDRFLNALKKSVLMPEHITDFT